MAILSLPEALVLRNLMDAQKKRLVFTNGCFDLLHIGHIRYLQQARKLGDALIVAINSDASVRSLKGKDRPLNPETERAEVLDALNCVDIVTIFNEKRVTHLLQEIKPHIYAKGGDYTKASLDKEESDMLEKIGATTHILPLVPSRSTTQLIENLQKRK